jgi:hypothetical protein
MTTSKPTGSIQFLMGDSTEVLRISKEGITANPDVPVDEIASRVLELLEWNIKLLVQRSVEAEREACAQVCEQRTTYSMSIPCPDGIEGCCVAHFVPGSRAKTSQECAEEIRKRGNT